MESIVRQINLKMGKKGNLDGADKRKAKPNVLNREFKEEDIGNRVGEISTPWCLEAEVEK